MQARADIYYERFTDENTAFNKGFHHNVKRLVTFFKKTECLSRKPKLSKADLSPTKSRKGQKRKKTQQQTNYNNPSKQPKITCFFTN